MRSSRQPARTQAAAAARRTIDGAALARNRAARCRRDATTRRSASKGSNDTTQLSRPADTVVDPDTNELFVADG